MTQINPLWKQVYFLEKALIFELLSVCWGKPAGCILKKIIIKVLLTLCVLCFKGAFHPWWFFQLYVPLNDLFVPFSAVLEEVFEMRKNFSFTGPPSIDWEMCLCRRLQFGDIYFLYESETLEPVCGIELLGTMYHSVLGMQITALEWKDGILTC